MPLRKHLTGERNPTVIMTAALTIALVRTTSVQVARSVLMHVDKETAGRSLWLPRLTDACYACYESRKIFGKVIL